MSINYVFHFQREVSIEKPANWDSMKEAQRGAWAYNQDEDIIPADLQDLCPLSYIATDQETGKVIYEESGSDQKAQVFTCCFEVPND